MTKTDTSRFDDDLKCLWQERGIVGFHFQDKRLPDELLYQIRDYAAVLYGRRI